MNELLERLRQQFESEEVRYAYVEGFLNAHIAAQIKELREGEKMSQQELADKIGTKQSGISRLENINYSAWKVESLRKLARAFGLWLDIDFREFGELPSRIQNFNEAGLQRRRFELDPIFNPSEQGGTLPADTEATREGVALGLAATATDSNALPERMPFCSVTSDDVNGIGAEQRRSA